MYKTFLILFLLNNSLISQHLVDHLVFEKIAQEIIRQEIEKGVESAKAFSDSIWIDKNSYGNEETILSSYEYSFEPNWVSDFNEDGEMDIIIRIEEAGMGTGALLVWSYTYYIVLLKGQSIKQIFTIQGGAKYSWGFLEIERVAGKEIFTNFSENKQNWEPEFYEQGIKEINLKLRFVYQENRFIESTYLGCKIFSINKSIFKPNTKTKINQLKNTAIYPFFEESYEEEINIRNKKIIGSLTGCNKPKIDFSISKPINAKDTLESIKEELSYLSKNVLWGQNELKYAKQYLEKHPPQNKSAIVIPYKENEVIRIFFRETENDCLLSFFIDDYLSIYIKDKIKRRAYEWTPLVNRVQNKNTSK